MKVRSLLFDAGCSICSDIAQQAEAEAGGWLRVRALQDEEMRALLAQAAPNHGRRPALVTQEDGRVTVDVGWTMLAKLAMGLGLRRSWRLLRRLHEAGPRPQASESAARRHLLRAFGGGTLATLSAVVSAHPDKETADEATLLTNEAHDAALSAVRGEAQVQVAEQQLLAQGFLPSTESAVILRSGQGDQLTMVFYPDAAGRPDRAGVMVHERASDGTTRVLAEVLQADPKGLFDADGRYRQGALQTATSLRIAENGGVVVPTSASAYFSCMFGCLGLTCARAAFTCRRLILLPAVLACLVSICGIRAYVCHRSCKSRW